MFYFVIWGILVLVKGYKLSQRFVWRENSRLTLHSAKLIQQCFHQTNPLTQFITIYERVDAFGAFLIWRVFFALWPHNYFPIRGGRAKIFFNGKNYGSQSRSRVALSYPLFTFPTLAFGGQLHEFGLWRGNGVFRFSKIKHRKTMLKAGFVQF